MLNLQTPALVGGGAAEPAASLHPNKATTTGESSVVYQADPSLTLLLPLFLICERDSKTLNFPGVAVPACGMEDFTSHSVCQ